MANQLAIQERANLALDGNPSPGRLLQLALEKETNIDVIERIVALVERERDHQALVSFDEALNRCQSRIGRIAPNQTRNDTRSWWADYAHLDKAIRPIYTEEGFSVGYSEVEPIHANKIRIKGLLSRAGTSREFFREITPSTTGPKGNAMVTATDADAIASARAKRYILINIFNISIAIDKDEKRGVPAGELAGEMAESEFVAHQENIKGANTVDELKNCFDTALAAAKKAGDAGAAVQFERFKNNRYREIPGAR